MIGKYIREFRRAKDLTQSELAHLSGINLQTISRIEYNETSPYWTTVARLCAAMNMSMDDAWTRMQAEKKTLTSP